jgi:hypothetical protein
MSAIGFAACCFFCSGFAFQFVLLANRFVAWLGVNLQLAPIEHQHFLRRLKSAYLCDLSRTGPFGNLVRTHHEPSVIPHRVWFEVIEDRQFSPFRGDLYPISH